MPQRNDGGPAYPIPCEDDRDCGPRFESGYGGMSLRQYAAIKLRVPDSGTDWLDDMIRRSLRDDLAAKVMQGTCALSEASEVSDDRVAIIAFRLAGAMLAARERS